MNLPSALRRQPKLSYTVIGLLVIVTIVAAVLAAVSKKHITTALMGGETRTIQFAGDHFLMEKSSDVKVSGVDVGIVTSVEPGPNGTALVDVKVSDETFAKVGSMPSARLRPTTLIGGVFYIDIVPGGDRTQPWEEDIPWKRTHLPVELDAIAERFQPDALEGASAAVDQLDATLGQGGTEALQDLLTTAPDTLDPGARVLQALRGDRPQVDLPELVGNLQQTSSVLTEQEGQLALILSGLEDTSSVLADTSEPVAAAIERLPATLDTADAGLTALDGTLERLRRTADPARPAVQQLTTMLDELDPVLAEARPVVRDLRGALRDTRPLVEQLVPTTQRGAAALEDLRGPVLDRINGPFKETVLSPFNGTGVYEHTAGDAPFYKELGYMLSNVNQAGAYVDDNGHAVAFQPGGGPGTPAGPVSLEEMFQDMFFPGGLHE